MAYNVESYWSFNRTLVDSVGTNDFHAYASTSYNNFTKYNLLSNGFDTQQGIVLQNEDWWQCDSISFGTSTHGMFISFWYYSPEVVGFTKNVVTKKSKSKYAPVLAKAETSISDDFESIISGDFILSEVSTSTTTNAMQLLVLNDPIGNNKPIISSSYTPGWHHVTIYRTDGDKSIARVEIDGDGGEWTAVPSFSSLTDNFYINKIGFDYTEYKKVQNGAIVSELIIASFDDINDFKTNDYSLDIMRFGPTNFIDQTDLKYYFLGMGYAQPSTISTNQIFVNYGNIYTARSNGQLMKGMRPIWDMEFAYGNRNDLNYLDVDDTSKITWTVDGIHVSGTKVRI